MTAEAAFVRSWAVGIYTATLSTPQPVHGAQRAACIEWAPSVPRNLTADEWQQYRNGRNAALSDLAEHIGGTVALVEL
jgi:hypothetical protein